ncbi:hypothetical protein [Halorarum halobium]|uniref:hypothetical protein n=1 Tax=Halorarum halobium TaxID=3075121 RepID=UPI0028A7075E|nr:hypothetical protein [Halobaculum sp. XH14]
MSEEDLDQETKEYIDYLHDRIQFLQQELEESEKTVLELRQEIQSPGGDGPLPTVDIEEFLESIEPSQRDLEELSAEDFSEFGDWVFHDPEEIRDDPRKAFEEMMNAAEQIEDHNEEIREVNDRIHENNEEWFGDK